LRTYQIRKERQQILKQIEKIQNNATNVIKITYSKKTAEGIKVDYNAKATAFKKVVEQMATSYNNLNSKLKMDSGSDLLHFIFANELQNLYTSVE